jgi:hypothetical protein
MSDKFIQQRKSSVIEELRAADRWLYANTVPALGWVRELLNKAVQELESESGALWLQTVTSRDGHVRVFVQGPFGTRELDILLEVLQLTRRWMERDESASDVRGVAAKERG